MMGEIVTYEEGGQRLCGELFRPGSANGRAALVVHEADGLGDNVRRRAAQLAALGYVALAPDLHGDGRTLAGEEMMTAVDAFRAAPERLRTRVAAGLAILEEQARLPVERTVALGYCFGGTAVLELARTGTPLAAVASFHGLLTTRSPAAPDAVRTRVAAFTGGLDPLVPPDDVAAFGREMTGAHADWQLTVYGQAWHSFTNIGVIGSPDPRMRYDPVADRLSWAAALAFFDAAFDGS